MRLGFLAGQVRSATGWATAFSFWRLAVRLAVVALMGRLLTPTDFGVVASSVVIQSAVYFLLDLGLVQYLVQKETVDKDDYAVLSTVSVSIALLAVVLLLAVPDFIAGIFQVPALSQTLVLLSVVFPLRAASLPAEVSLLRDLNLRTIAVTEMAASFLGYALTSVVLAFYGFGYWAAIVGQVIQQLIKTGGLLLSSRVVPTMIADLGRMIQSVRKSIPYTMGRIWNTIALQGDTLVIARLLGPELLGFYSRAFALINIGASTGGQVLDSVVFPVVARLQKEEEDLPGLFLGLLALASLVLLPLSLALCLLSREVVLVLLGPQWRTTGDLLSFFGFALCLRLTYKIAGSFLRGLGEPARFSRAQFLFALEVVMLCAVGAAGGGLTGATIGVLLALLLNNSYLLWSTRQLLGIDQRKVINAIACGLVPAFPIILLLAGLALTGVGRVGEFDSQILLIKIAAVGASFLIIVLGVLSLGRASRSLRIWGSYIPSELSQLIQVLSKRDSN